MNTALALRDIMDIEFAERLKWIKKNSIRLEINELQNKNVSILEKGFGGILPEGMEDKPQNYVFGDKGGDDIYLYNCEYSATFFVYDFPDTPKHRMKLNAFINQFLIENRGVYQADNEGMVAYNFVTNNDNFANIEINLDLKEDQKFKLVDNSTEFSIKIGNRYYEPYIISNAEIQQAINNSMEQPQNAT